MSFTDFSLNPALQRGISGLGFTEPTPIQAAALPQALDGRDVLATAMTGSGKTAAFVLPILQRLMARPAGSSRALILTPTRELAAQIHEHIQALGRFTRVRSATVFGGVKSGPQERALRSGVDIVVATPGRLLDLAGKGLCSFRELEVLVIDEADRMLDMGFLPDVRRILSRLPRDRQTMLFSATMPGAIVALSRELLTDPSKIGVERQAVPATGVSQSLLPVAESLKPMLLLELLRRDEVGTALVFTRTKHRANRLAKFLDGAGINCDRIHGNRSQAQREAALRGFKAGQVRILVATDIAARGIDVQGLPHVINFDVPAQAEDYIHRVGRTARAQTTGEALTFVTPSDTLAVASIERNVGKRLDRRTLDGFDYEAAPKGRLEIPVAERIAALRAQRTADRARARAKADRRAQSGPARHAASTRDTRLSGPSGPRRSSGRPRDRRRTAAA